MTDKEIIALVESKLPEELTLEEIDLIRRQMRASPMVRRALAGQLELDQSLASLIGKVELSPEEIYSGASRMGRLGRSSIFSWLGWTACFVMIGFVVSMLVWAIFIRPGNEAKPIAGNNEVQPNDAKGAAVADPNSAANKLDAAATVVPQPDGMAANIVAAGSDRGRLGDPQKLPVNPVAVPGKRGRIELPAAAARLDHATLDQKEYGRGMGVLVGGDHSAAEFDFFAPLAGNYRIELRYAAAEARPLKMSLNGAVVKDRAAANVTGNWYPEGQRWFSEGVVRLVKGKNLLRLEAEKFFPHVSRVALEPVIGEVNLTGPSGPPPLPWMTKENLGGPARSMEDISLDQFDHFNTAPSHEESRRWFTALDGGHIDMRDYNGMRIPSLDGRLRLNPPLAEDTVLRLSLYEAQLFSIHFWHGQKGLTLRNYDYKGAMVAYTLAGPDRNHPLRTLAATDDDRNWRTNQTVWPLRIDIRFHKGLLVASRGDVELLRAPFEGLPEEVIFEGHALVRGMALVRTTSEPAAEPAQRPIVADIAKPAELKWESQVPQGMTFAKRDDGSVELKSQQSQQPGWMAAPLPGGELGLNELIVELDDVTPGSNVGLGSMQNDPKPKATVGFLHDNNSGGISFRWNNYGDATMDHGVDYNGGMGAANAGKHFWVKFIGGCGLKCYTSVDGLHWARMLQPMDGPPYPLTHLAVWCPQSGQPRSIRVKRITMRKFEAVEALAPPAEVMAKAPTLPIPDFGNWANEVAKKKPAEVGSGAWRRACALKTLAAGGSVWAIRPVVELLADEAAALPGSPEDQVKRLDDLALLNDVWGDGGAASNFMHRYEQFGQRLARGGATAVWSHFAPKLINSPLWCAQQYYIGGDRLMQQELLETVYNEKPEEAARLLARLRVWNKQDPLVPWGSEWAMRHGENEPAAPRDAPRIDRRHPFIEELNKEGFNLLGDFQAAMASKAYHDACQIVTSSDASETLGLWPDAQDPQLLVSINGAIDLAMSHEKALRDTMVREFGPLGMLQVRQAMNEADAAAVAAVTTRYRGTDAAAQALLWLGDRAMSSGEFAAARADYRRAAKVAGPQIVELLAPRDRLAAAMLGQDSGHPANVPVQLGDAQLSPGDFEKLVEEMRRTHHSAAGNDVSASAAPASVAPAPVAFELREIGRVDGEMGDNPGDFGALAPSRDQQTRFYSDQKDRKRFFVNDQPAMPLNRGIDWAGRQLACAIDGDAAFVSNRFEICAFNLKEGRRVWQVGVGGEHAKTHDWTLTPMRPTVAGSRLYVRRLVKTGPELAALEKNDGKLVWRTRTGLLVVSDPLWLDHSLIALTLSRADQQSILYLSTFDPSTGVVIAQERLATLREGWWQQRTCQLTALKETLVAVFGGTVLCCDRSGKTLWVRRQEWIPPQDDRDWARQYQQPPLVWQDRLFVSQPGVAAVECIDAESGELTWRKVFTVLKRLVGVVDDRLIVETQHGLVALSAAKGDSLWHHDMGDLLEGQLCGGPGKLLYTRREKTPGNENQLRPVLVWLDPATGAERPTVPLDSLKHDHPMFGPFMSAQDRIWAFAAGGENEPVRILYELTPKGPAGITSVNQGRQARPIPALANGQVLVSTDKR